MNNIISPGVSHGNVASEAKGLPVDFSNFLKFLHVTAAVLWVGGGFAMILASCLLASHASAQAQLAFVRVTALLGLRFFVPLSMVTLASGVALLFLDGWGWQPFTVLGLAGIVIVGAFGGLVLGPACERAVMTGQTHGVSAALPQVRRIRRLAIADYAVQFAIVFVMVVKPGWDDVAVFSGLVIVVGLAVMFAATRLFRTA